MNQQLKFSIFSTSTVTYGIKNLIGLILLGFSFSALAQKGIHESIAFEKPPVIDGKMDDWPIEWWLDPDGKFLSNVGNDAENLYFRLKVSDDITQAKIGMFGLSLRLNPKGKKKGKVGLKYPVGKDESELKHAKPINISKDVDLAEKVQMKKEWISDVEVVELIGLAKNNIVSSRLGLMNGIESTIIAQEDGSYIYEAKIPFKAFNIKKNEVDLLGVEFETGRLVQKSNNATSSNPGYNPNSRGPGSQPRQYYSNYSYNPLSSPGYLWIGLKLK